VTAPADKGGWPYERYGPAPTPRLGHAFVEGVGGHLALYCQHPAEAGTEAVPGYPSKNCGYLESAHTMTAEQQVAADQAEADKLIETIWKRARR
jgi:hypothetical protein